MNGEPVTPPEPAREPPRGGLFRRRVALQSAKDALQPEGVPPPPPPQAPASKRRPTLSAISGFFSFLLVLAFVLAGLGGYAQHQLREPGPLPADKVVLIAPRSEVPEILALLEKEGVIDNGFLLNAALLISGDRKKLRAGEYLFKANASMRDVIDTLVSGREILHSVTIPEGLTSQQIIDRLKESDLLSGDLRDIPKEGALLPDTYRVSRGMARGDLVRKMQEDQKKALEQIWSRRSPDLPLRSSFDLLTLASIVEKETGKADERPRVAGVFINRLKNRMRLQSDPTIVYGIVGGKGTLGRGILRSEVEKPTPYNTYAIDGLPPGPIANPGRAAMEAVANPSRTKDLYFVADGTGGHVFAETLDQHNKNVAKWRQVERDRAAAAATGAAIGVDRAPPPPTPAATPILRDQRGELDWSTTPAFGALPSAFQRNEADPLAFSQPSQAVASPAAAAINSARGVPVQPEAVAAPTAKTTGLTATFGLAAKIDESIAAQLGLSDSPSLDSTVDVDGAVTDPGAYPESPARRAEQKARAARYGAASGGDALDLPVVADLAATPKPVEAPVGPKITRIYDASEGTALDPLKDRSWDLNSAKSVPSLGPDPTAPGRKPDPRTRRAQATPAR